MSDRVNFLVRASLAGLIVFVIGFVLGTWHAIDAIDAKPMLIAAQPHPEIDISPKGEVRTVIVTKTVPGPPTPPPMPMPKELGQQISTTSTELPALPSGGTFHESAFVDVHGKNLELRTIEWLDTPGGRVRLGPSETRDVQAPITWPIPAERHWSVLALAGMQVNRGTVAPWVGAETIYTRRAFTAAAEVLHSPIGGTLAMIGAGLRF